MRSRPESCLVPAATGLALSVSRSLMQVQLLSEAYRSLLWDGSSTAPRPGSVEKAAYFLLDEKAFA
jgi:hypothetical protein